MFKLSYLINIHFNMRKDTFFIKKICFEINDFLLTNHIFIIFLIQFKNKKLKIIFKKFYEFYSI